MDSGHALDYQPSARPPPPTGPTPMYARTLQRLFPYSLRPVIIFTCVISLLYLILQGGNDFKDAGNDDVSSKLKMFLIIQGILFIAAAAVELFGFYTAYTQRLPLARIYSYASLVAYAAVVASEILGVIVTFTLKSDVIASCTAYYTGAYTGSGSFWGDNSNSTPLTAAQAASYCQRLWSSGRTWDIVWLIVSVILGALFVMISFAYVRQLLDPNSVKVRVSRFQARQNQQQQQPDYYHHQGAAAPPYNQAGMHAPYDPSAAAFSYPPNTGSPPYGMYAPPQGPPPPGSGAAGAPPTYQGRGSLDDYDPDSKTPQDSGYGYNYGPNDGSNENPFRNPVPRPGSSRNVAMHPDDEDDDVEDRTKSGAKRDSADTLRGEEAGIRKGATPSRSHRNDDDDDGTPRI